MFFFPEHFEFFVNKLRESTGTQSQMFSGSVGDVCDALSRFCVLSGDENRTKNVKTQDSESRFLTMPQLGDGWQQTGF